MKARVPDFAAELTATQLKLHHDGTPAAVIASALAGVALAALLHREAPVAALLAWLAVLAAALGLRSWVHQAHARSAGDGHPSRWLRRYRAALGLQVLVWVALGLWLLGRVAPAALVPVLALGVMAGGAALLVALSQQRTLRAMVAARLLERDRAQEAERARRELADQTELQRQLLRTTHQGYWFIDTEGRTTDLNTAMCALLGQRREAVLGRRAPEFFDEAARAVLERELARRRAGIAGTYEIDIERADGTRVHCLNNATPLYGSDGRHVGSVGLWTDITQQKRTEQALRTHEWLVNAVTDPVSLIGPDGRYLMVNEAWCAGAGVLREAAVGQRVAEVLGPRRFAAEQAQALAECVATRVPQRVRVRVMMYDRGERLLETMYYPYHDPSTGMHCVGALSRDITVEEQTAQALTAARDEAERANRAKSQFLAQMSHELRTPMNAIVGFAQLLENDPTHPLAEHQRRYVREGLRAARHLLTLLDELLDLGRIEAGKLAVNAAAVPLADLADECLALLRPLAAPRGVLLHEARVGDAVVWADPLRLRQVLLNLLGNAVKYNRAGGAVRLSARREGEEWLIAVDDEGPGLDADQIARLFEPFERLGAEHTGIEGTGIGLALSRRLVEAMGGRVGVDSEPGRGSRFWVVLPAAGPASRADGDATEPAPLDAISGAQVLYIEDNPVNLVLMEAMLARLGGVELRCAALPQEGLRMAAERVPALILLDIQLPGMSGFDVLARLRASRATAQVPVVAVSAHAQPEDLEAARRAGFDDYLTKPLHLPLLLATVQRLLAGARSSP